MATSPDEREALQQAFFLYGAKEQHTPLDAPEQAALPTEQADDGLSSRAKTRTDAGFSLDKDTDKDTDKDKEKEKNQDKPLSSSQAGAIGASQAKHTAQLSRTQMVQGSDAALTAQARRLSPRVLVLLF